MAYGDFKDLIRRAISTKVLRDKAFNIAKIQNTMNINVDLLQCPNRRIMETNY